MNITTAQTDWHERGFCKVCGAAAGQPCRRSIACVGRPMLPAGTAAADLEVPAAGPIWTNGQAPAAVNVVQCPTWCTSHTHLQVEPTASSRPHELEILSLAVLDDELTSDVPLRVVLRQDTDQDAQGARVYLEIGHALYQPTAVALSRSDTARITAAMITGNSLIGQNL